eukprot:scaffold659843_cov43-Prasinocladus_malaysianus.AAC.2
MASVEVVQRVWILRGEGMPAGRACRPSQAECPLAIGPARSEWPVDAAFPASPEEPLNARLTAAI